MRTGLHPELAELENAEMAPFATEPHLAEQHGSAGLKQNGAAYEQNEGAENDQGDYGDANIEDAPDSISAAGLLRDFGHWPASFKARAKEATTYSTWLSFMRA